MDVEEDILNNNELQLPVESRNSCVMRADAQILSSVGRTPARSDLVAADYAHLTTLPNVYPALPLSVWFLLFCFMCPIVASPRI